ncbi:hypothetical protein H112_05230 [Trichophyton rubrum D6]|uniref:Cytomegalovirus gH-receptor family protein n=2 Tax=Trichophyton rubrum TaxID=5551 RepID=F2SLW9_TRIRC|nr:uncharacterized protein TERG_02983 [Trichophyton rubrum CBS 118892]EZF20191.1 hypothetical protein H100_05252 [Trichophyton rubrum MR850]EZF40755.1 hypothetical protein H102_05242 [Trichophyton rubrum CBS 100081]EZF51372.1 hypothetical protein H103_05243 [Trichophyton rubrum CBS 288.86]EZF62053.1 hypothetical protein H104_05233 [Trichophyton rubrum CBS 289.86]EZF83426.1 hypothetical protein H110_05240 [Trichophyton rubrum MR1448]EZF94083.1 hypothetical protein H113_05281 [Trichophyton rubr
MTSDGCHTMNGLGIDDGEGKGDIFPGEVVGSSLLNGGKQRSEEVDELDYEEQSAASSEPVLAALIQGKQEDKFRNKYVGISSSEVNAVAAVEVGDNVDGRQLPSPAPTPEPESQITIWPENVTDEDPTALKRPAGLIPRPAAADVTLKDRSYTSSHPSKSNKQNTGTDATKERDKVQKLSPAKLQDLTSSPEFSCLRVTDDADTDVEVDAEKPQVQQIPPSKLALDVSPVEVKAGPELEPSTAPPISLKEKDEEVDVYDVDMGTVSGSIGALKDRNRSRARTRRSSTGKKQVHLQDPLEFHGRRVNSDPSQPLPTSFRPRDKASSVSVPVPATGREQLYDNGSNNRSRRMPSPLKLDAGSRSARSSGVNRSVSPVPASIPIPPFSIPTYLQLELSSHRPSSLYIHRSGAHDFPYESSRVMLERLQNFFLLPPLLEQALCFGTLACLDSWLHTFTLLPLQFLKAVYILLQSWMINLGLEIRFVASYIVSGLGRMWKRRRRRDSVRETTHEKPVNIKDASQKLIPIDPSPIAGSPALDPASGSDARRRRGSTTRRHQRTKSIPSTLLENDKADILKGLLMIFTCTILMYFDASRMYHWIRGQAAIKLYVIYNVLEVGDRLLSAIGQDVLECLFSQEALERRPDGRSKVVRPFWMFIFALIYTVIHATALFYQVMTLNVAVNSYSNALITLLLSNQFVEIKSTVFKRFEKENLFQLTCADVVERFQLWLMLIIIASRNFVETGGFKLGNALTSQSSATTTTNSTTAFRPSTSILPQSFTLLIPSSVFSSLSSVNSILPAIGHLLAPFLVVLGSEMVVDWLKHAYISKFNNLKPAMYGRFLDILAKDYYSSAFSDPNLNRRLGLPVIPLACLFFRVSVQTYQMFLTAWLPQLSSSPLYPPPSNATSLTEIHSHYAPISGSSASLSSILPGFSNASASTILSSISLSTIAQAASSLFQTLVSYATPSPESFVPIFTVILVLLLYITLLLGKLVLGMILLGYSRTRYKNMKYREREYAAQQKREQRRQQPQQYMRSTSPLPHVPSLSAQTIESSSFNRASHSNSDMIEGGRRGGGWGAVEVGEDKRRWIYVDDPEGLRRLRDREAKSRSDNPGGSGTGAHGLENVKRYEMAAKRIW